WTCAKPISAVSMRMLILGTLRLSLFPRRLSAILRLDCELENFRCRTISTVYSHGATSITAHSFVVCTDMGYACGGLGVLMKPNRYLSVCSGSIQRITRALDSSSRTCERR